MKKYVIIQIEIMEIKSILKDGKWFVDYDNRDKEIIRMKNFVNKKNKWICAHFIHRNEYVERNRKILTREYATKNMGSRIGSMVRS